MELERGVLLEVMLLVNVGGLGRCRGIRFVDCRMIGVWDNVRG